MYNGLRVWCRSINDNKDNDGNDKNEKMGAGGNKNPMIIFIYSPEYTDSKL